MSSAPKLTALFLTPAMSSGSKFQMLERSLHLSITILPPLEMGPFNQWFIPIMGSRLQTRRGFCLLGALHSGCAPSEISLPLGGAGCLGPLSWSWCQVFISQLPAVHNFFKCIGRSR